MGILPNMYIMSISGWWLTYPSEKYEFVNGKDHPIYYGKIKNVPNHQPDIYIYIRHGEMCCLGQDFSPSPSWVNLG